MRIEEFTSLIILLIELNSSPFPLIGDLHFSQRPEFEHLINWVFDHFLYLLNGRELDHRLISFHTLSFFFVTNAHDMLRISRA